jgi:hypothetical protein
MALGGELIIEPCIILLDLNSLYASCKMVKAIIFKKKDDAVKKMTRLFLEQIKTGY